MTHVTGTRMRYLSTVDFRFETKWDATPISSGTNKAAMTTNKHGSQSRPEPILLRLAVSGVVRFRLSIVRTVASHLLDTNAKLLVP
jgi:hypothetical protein